MVKNDQILDFEVSMESSHCDASVGEGVGGDFWGVGGLELECQRPPRRGPKGPP